MSPDQTITRKRNKLTIAAAAGTLTVATAASAAAASWPSGSPASPAGTAFSAVTARSGQAVPARHAAQEYLAAWHVKFATEHQALTILAHRQAHQAHQAASSAPAASGSARWIAKRMLASFGWSTSQFSCLEPLWAGESGWNVTASNPSTGAYGIPQALPASKMASTGPDWRTSAVTQIRWGLTYIKGTYGSPCAAWSHAQADGWY